MLNWVRPGNEIDRWKAFSVHWNVQCVRCVCCVSVRPCWQLASPIKNQSINLRLTVHIAKLNKIENCWTLSPSLLAVTNNYTRWSDERCVHVDEFPTGVIRWLQTIRGCIAAPIDPDRPIKYPIFNSCNPYSRIAMYVGEWDTKLCTRVPIDEHGIAKKKNYFDTNSCGGTCERGTAMYWRAHARSSGIWIAFRRDYDLLCLFI